MDLNITNMCKHSRPYLILIDNKFSESCQCAETLAESPKFIVFPYNCILLKKNMSMHLPLAMMFKGFGQPVTVTYPVTQRPHRLQILIGAWPVYPAFKQTQKEAK